MQNQFLFADQLVYFYHPDSRELFCVNSHHLRGVAKFNVKLFYFQGSVYSTDQTIHHDWKV